MASKFYIYTNAPNNKALIHLGDCVHCNHGQGQDKPKSQNPTVDTWSEPLTKQQARTKARRSGKKTIRWCGFCAKKLGIEPNDV